MSFETGKRAVILSALGESLEGGKTKGREGKGRQIEYRTEEKW